MRYAWENIEMPTHFDGKHKENTSLGRPAVYQKMLLELVLNK
jgi:hypothetical protein